MSAPARTCSAVNACGHALSAAADAQASMVAHAAHARTRRLTAGRFPARMPPSDRSLRHQREGPNRSSLWHVLELLARRVPPQPADARQHGDVLAAVVRVGDRHRIDARAGLELTTRIVGVGVDGHELDSLIAGAQNTP